jgi:hypothetical protein
MGGTRLGDSDRAFFTALERVIYGNPFSDERSALIRTLVAGTTGNELALDREALARMVEPRLRAFSNVAELQRLNAADRDLVRTAFLYVCYHRHVPPRSVDGATHRRQRDQRTG